MAIAMTLSLIRSIGPRARSFASFEKRRAPAVSTIQTKMVDPKERAAVTTAEFLVEMIPIILRAPYFSSTCERYSYSATIFG